MKLLIYLFCLAGSWVWAVEPAAQRQQLWERYCAEAGKSILPDPVAVEGKGDLRREMHRLRRDLELGDKCMPYVFLQKGKKPEGGWPLFINLHGGGGNPAAPGPHAWPVNTREWQAQVQLFQAVYPIEGLAFIPRMVDDREGRWYYDYIQEAIDRVIEDAILHHGVNPDRVYLTGISEGGYAGFRLASFMADRWAGSCAMAAAEPLGNAPPENLRNIAFRCGIGENDTFFNRIGLARDYFKQLEALKKEDGEGYEFFFDEQKGRGHGIAYAQGPKWLVDFTREAQPKKVNWTVIRQHEKHRQRLYWLALDGEPGEMPVKIQAEVKAGNLIEIQAQRRVGEAWEPAKNLKLRVYLPDAHLDPEQPIKILVNGQAQPAHRFQFDEKVARQSLAERGDPRAIYLDSCVISL